MPYLPQHHLTATMGTNKWVIPACFHYHLSIVLASYRKGLPALGCIRRHYALYFLSNLLIHCCCMQSIIPYPLHPFGQYVLHHPSDKAIHIYFFLFASAALVVIIPIRYPLPIIALYPPHRYRRTHHILGQIFG